MPIEMTALPEEDAYATANQLASGLGITPGENGAPDTATMDAFLERASRRIDKEHQGESFDSETSTEYHSLVEDTYYIVTKKRPIVSITSLEMWDGTIWRAHTEDTDLTKLNTSDYFYCPDKANGIVKFTSMRSLGKDVLRIVYNHGYATVPKWVEELCLKMAMFDVINHMITSTTMDLELTQSEEVLESWYKMKRQLREDINDIIRNHLRKGKAVVGVL